MNVGLGVLRKHSVGLASPQRSGEKARHDGRTLVICLRGDGGRWEAEK